MASLGRSPGAAPLTTADIPDNSITAAKIVEGTILAGDLAPDSVDSSELVDGSVDLSHMSVNSVDSDQYVDGSIDLAHMSVNSIDSDQYVDGSIDLAHMSVNSIDSDQYVDGSIDNAHIADNAIDSEHYAAGSIDNEHLADDAVGTDELANDVVIDTSGAITTTGAFTSVGITDGAVGATAITIKSDETVGIRNTDPTPFNGVGIHIGDGSTSTASLAIEDDEKQWDIYVNGAMLLRNTTASRNMITLSEESGDVTVNTGDLVFETAGKGVVLGAITNVDANTLDDYEEGTWTAACTATSGTIAFYSNWNTGRYTKIGNTVHISGMFFVETISSPSGSLSITGLPFTTPSGNSNYNAISIRPYGWNTAVNALSPYVPSGSSNIAIENLNGTSTNAAGFVYASSYIMIGGSYKV